MANAPTPILIVKKRSDITIPTMNFPFGVFFALESLYALSPRNANDTKNNIPKNTPDTTIKSVFACAALIPIEARALGF